MAHYVQGELVTSFEDHDLWYPDAQTNNIYITHNQSLILSYCKVRMPVVKCLGLQTSISLTACRKQGGETSSRDLSLKQRFATLAPVLPPVRARMSE